MDVADGRMQSAGVMPPHPSNGSLGRASDDADDAGTAAENNQAMKEKRHNDPNRRTLKTVSMYLQYIVCGIINTILGPTFLTMAILLHTDMTGMSLSFIGLSVAFTLGCGATGLVYKRMRSELFFAACALTMGLGTALAPYTGHLYAFITCISVEGFARASVLTGSQSYIIDLWAGHRYKDAVLQAMHGFYALGGFLGPFLVKPFLTNLDSFNLAHVERNANSFRYNGTVSGELPLFADREVLDERNTAATPMLLYNDTDTVVSTELEMVKYAYVLAGILTVLPMTCFLLVLCAESMRGRRREESLDTKTSVVVDGNSSSALKQQSRSFTVIILILFCCFFGGYVAIEIIMSGLLAPFVVEGLRWPNQLGPLIASTFWGCHALGRVAGAPVSTVLSPQHMLALDLVVTAAGLLLMLFSHYHYIIVWLAAGLTGFGTATMFASAVLMAACYIPITGASSAAMFVGGSLGAMVWPPLTGYLFQTHGHMTMVYVLLGTVAWETICFATCFAYGTRCSGTAAAAGSTIERDLQDADTEMRPLREKVDEPPESI